MRSPSGVSNEMTGRGDPPGGPGRVSTTLPSAFSHARRCSRSRRSVMTVLPAIPRPITNKSTPASVARTGYSAMTTPLRDVHADGAGDAGAADPAVAVGVLRKVLLVVVLGKVELGRRQNLGRDRTVTGLGERLLVLAARPFRRLPLRLVVVVNAGAVLRADVVALPHALRRVVALPEHLQQVLVGHLLRVEDHEHHFVVAGE